MRRLLIIGLSLNFLGIILTFLLWLFCFNKDILFIKWGQDSFIILINLWSMGYITEINSLILTFCIYYFYLVPVISIFSIDSSIFFYIIILLNIWGLLIIIISELKKGIKSRVSF